MKQGTNNHLKVKFDGIDPNDIARVMFVFSQTKDGPILERHFYEKPGVSPVPSRSDVTLENGVFSLLFTKDDTYRFRANTTFFMDTRVYMVLNGAVDTDGDNPQTPIVAIRMDPTLFYSEDNPEAAT